MPTTTLVPTGSAQAIRSQVGYPALSWTPSTSLVGSGSITSIDLGGANFYAEVELLSKFGIGVIPAGAIIDDVTYRITHSGTMVGATLNELCFCGSSYPGTSPNAVDFVGFHGVPWPGHLLTDVPAGSQTWTANDDDFGSWSGGTIEDFLDEWHGFYAKISGGSAATLTYTITAFEVDVTWHTVGSPSTLPTVTEPSLPPGTPYTEDGVPHTMPWPDATLTPCGHTITYHYPDSFITIDGVVTPLGPLTVDCFTLPYNGPQTPVSRPGGYYHPTAPTTGWIPGSPTEYGWYWSFEGFSGAGHVTIGGRPAIPRSFDEIAVFAAGGAGYMGGFPGGAVSYHNRLIYASQGAPAIRVFDGQSDRQVVKIPATSSGATPIAIMSMMVAAGSVFIATLDSGTTSANFAGRVFRFDPTTLKLEPMGAGFSGGEVPYALCWHMGRLWVGTNKSSGAGGKVYYLRPDIDAAWTADYTLATSSAGGALSMASYHGKLYVGCDAAAGTFAKVIVRDTAGAYTTARTGAGGTAKVNNGFPYLCVFDDRLYASFWNEDTTAISYIDSYDGTTWGLSYTGAGDTLRPFLAMFVENDLLYIYGGGLGLVASLTTLDTSDTPTELTAFLLGDTTGIPMFGVVVL